MTLGADSETRFVNTPNMWETVERLVVQFEKTANLSLFSNWPGVKIEDKKVTFERVKAGQKLGGLKVYFISVEGENAKPVTFHYEEVLFIWDESGVCIWQL